MIAPSIHDVIMYHIAKLKKDLVVIESFPDSEEKKLAKESVEKLIRANLNRLSVNMENKSKEVPVKEVESWFKRIFK
jgi:hypothetical protein